MNKAAACVGTGMRHQIGLDEARCGITPKAWDSVRAAPFTLIEKVVVQFSIAVDLAAFLVTARLLPWGICLDAGDDLFVIDKAFEEFLRFCG